MNLPCILRRVMCVAKLKNRILYWICTTFYLICTCSHLFRLPAHLYVSVLTAETAQNYSRATRWSFIHPRRPFRLLKWKISTSSGFTRFSRNYIGTCANSKNHCHHARICDFCRSDQKTFCQVKRLYGHSHILILK